MGVCWQPCDPVCNSPQIICICKDSRPGFGWQDFCLRFMYMCSKPKWTEPVGIPACILKVCWPTCDPSCNIPQIICIWIHFWLVWTNQTFVNVLNMFRIRTNSESVWIPTCSLRVCWPTCDPVCDAPQTIRICIHFWPGFEWLKVYAHSMYIRIKQNEQSR